MRTINISISELEYNKFGLKEDKLSSATFIDIVFREISRQNLQKWPVGTLAAADAAVGVPANPKDGKREFSFLDSSLGKNPVSW